MWPRGAGQEDRESESLLALLGSYASACSFLPPDFLFYEKNIIVKNTAVFFLIKIYLFRAAPCSLKWKSESVSRSVLSNSLWPHGLQPTRLFSPWNSPARILEWVAIPFSRECSRPRDGTWVSHITGRFFTIWATREAHAAYGILIPWPGITPGPLKWKPLVLTPGPLGNSPMSRYCYLQISYLITLMYLLVYI